MAELDLSEFLETIENSITEEFKKRYAELIKAAEDQKEYQRGLYNGLEMACSIIQKREANYK
jgi:hypothetical protein